LGVLVLTTISVVNRFHFFRPIFILLLLIFICIGIAYFNDIFEYILALVGKDSSLTGRTSIWLALLPTIEDNLVLGVGYSAFWPNAGQYFQDYWLTELNHAHNTYIELVVDLGFAGFILCMSFLLVAYRALFKDMMARLPQANIIFTLWTVIFIIGFSGKVVFVPNSGLWVLMIALLVSSSQNKLIRYKDMQ
jgi:exopolysaccharide production protein ExoQ